MPRIAILIDAENVDPIFAQQIFDYAQAQGTVTHKEIYGAGIALNEWADPILTHAIHMNMTLRPNRFKNSSDIALVIGAMDLITQRALNAETGVDTVILASSDCDFSALAIRLRTAGVEVVGMGNPEKTNPMWPKACSKFVALKEQPQAAPQKEQAKDMPEKKPEKKPDKPELQPAPKQQKATAVRITPSHSGRISNIKRFIAAQLVAHEGRMASSALFSALNELADYKYDQQRSKRKPLDYLARQVGDAVKIEEAPDGGVWIYAAEEAPAPAAREEEAPAPAEPEALPAAEAGPELGPEAEEEPLPAAEPEIEPEAQMEQPQAPAAEELPNPVLLFIQDGIEEETARRIVALCDESTNLKTAYDKLRKAFGASEGRKYYQLVKKHTVQYRR